MPPARPTKSPPPQRPKGTPSKAAGKAKAGKATDASVATSESDDEVDSETAAANGQASSSAFSESPATAAAKGPKAPSAVKAKAAAAGPSAPAAKLGVLLGAVLQGAVLLFLACLLLCLAQATVAMVMNTVAMVMNKPTADVLFSDKVNDYVLFLSTAGVFYKWPPMDTAGRLLKWFVGILFTVGLMTSLLVIEPLQTVSPLYAAVKAGDRVRTAELLEYKHVRKDINVGKRSGLGLLASDTPLFEAVENNHTEVVAALLKAGATPLETQ